MPTVTPFSVEVTGRSSGTVNVLLFGFPLPCKVYTCYNEPEKARLACPHCSEYIAQPRICVNEACDLFNHQLKDEHSPVRVASTDDGEVIPLNETDLDQLELPSLKAMPLGSVVPFKEVEHLTYFAKGSHYLVPANKHVYSAYMSIARVLHKSKRVMPGKYILRSGNERLGLLRTIDGNQLILQEIPFEALLRCQPKIFGPEITKADEAKAAQLLDAMEQTFEHGSFTDEFGDALTTLIAKISAQRHGKAIKEVKAAQRKEATKRGSDALDDMLTVATQSKRLGKSDDTSGRPSGRKTKVVTR